MTNPKITKIEETYLGLFKVVLLVVLTLALIASAVLLLKASVESLATPKTTEPAKKAERKPTPEQKPAIAVDGFLDSISPKEVPKEEPKANEEKPAEPQVKAEDNVGKMVDEALGKMWIYLSAYQDACQAPQKIDKDTLLRAFPRHVMHNWFRIHGKDFMESQDAFEKALLSNPKIIEYCKAKAGKGQLFARSLDWHASEYTKQLKSIEASKLEALRKLDDYDASELMRVERFDNMESARVEREHVQAKVSFFTAASAFGIFMSLALLLILSKIESNLRGFRLTPNTPEIS